MNAPVASPETAIAVIDPKSYAAWDPLLDLFDEIRSEHASAADREPDRRP